MKRVFETAEFHSVWSRIPVPQFFQPDIHAYNINILMSIVMSLKPLFDDDIDDDEYSLVKLGSVCTCMLT